MADAGQAQNAISPDDVGGSAVAAPKASAVENAPVAGAAATGDVLGADGVRPLDLPSFGGKTTGGPAQGINLLGDVNLHVRIELGRTRMLVEDVLKLAEGSVVELDKLAGDPVDVYVNDQHVARGEVLVLNDNFCVRVNEIVTQAESEAA
ncbi:MAG: flagellar motor switch protein FliN [Phycisphaerae bacterium]|nr:flagellar motor switch protein FliN [Phycisphaerae bacterium]